MPEDINPDLNYQPKTKTFSFTETESKKKFRKWIIILASFFSFGLCFLIIIFFVLNYFSIISLYKVSNIFNNLPQSENSLSYIIKKYNEQRSIPDIQDLGNNTFKAYVQVAGFGNNNIKVKLHNGKVIDLEVTSDTYIQKIAKKGKSDSISTSDLLQNENKGKNAIIKYSKDKNKNILNSIEIIN